MYIAFLQCLVAGVFACATLGEESPWARQWTLSVKSQHAAPMIAATAALRWTNDCDLAGQLESANADDKAIAKDKEKLKGNWQVKKMVIAGKSVPENEVEKLSARFDGDSCTWEGQVAEAGDDFMVIPGTTKTQFTIDPTKKPKEIDITFSKDKVFPAIYDLDGDKLRICMGLGNDRPDMYSSKEGESTYLIELERVKK